VQAIKFHQLQVFDTAPIYRHYLGARDEYYPFTIDSYTDFVIAFLERLNPRIAVERFAAESPPGYRVVNGWGNFRVEQLAKKIESVMEVKETCQGIKFKKSI
jgi:radical SAM superfamily enzyme